MTTFERWFIRRVFARDFVQGHDHARNIERVYGLVREVCEDEFTEDNAPTIDAFLSEQFKKTQYSMKE